MDLGHETEDVLKTSLQTELSVARSMCVLAGQGPRQKRAHHLQEAEKAFQLVLKIAKHTGLSKQERNAIEQTRRDILSLGGKASSENMD